MPEPRVPARPQPATSVPAPATRRYPQLPPDVVAAARHRAGNARLPPASARTEAFICACCGRPDRRSRLRAVAVATLVASLAMSALGAARRGLDGAGERQAPPSVPAATPERAAAELARGQYRAALGTYRELARTHPQERLYGALAGLLENLTSESPRPPTAAVPSSAGAVAR